MGNRKIKIAATSDWHGELPEIPKCDVLIIAGDIVPRDCQDSVRGSLIWFETKFLPHIKKAPCKKCLFVAGNHDFFLTPDLLGYINAIIAYHGLSKKLVYLLDDEYEYRGLKFYGCPWTVSPPNWAFYTSCPEWIYKRIPAGVDILICHQAPLVGSVGTSNKGRKNEKEWGSPDLAYNIVRARPRYVICGHIHSGDHAGVNYNGSMIYNVSLLNEGYMAVNPVTVLLVEPWSTIYKEKSTNDQ